MQQVLNDSKLDFDRNILNVRFVSMNIFYRYSIIRLKFDLGRWTTALG